MEYILKIAIIENNNVLATYSINENTSSQNQIDILFNTIKNNLNNYIIIYHDNIDFNTINFNSLIDKLILEEKHFVATPLIISKYSFPNTISDNIDTTSCVDSSLKYYNIPYIYPLCMAINSQVLHRFKNLTALNTNIWQTLFDLLIKINEYGYSFICDYSFLINANNIALNIRVDDYLFKLFSSRAYFNKQLSSLNNSKPKILLSMLQLAPLHNGTSIHALSLAKEFIKKYSDKYEIHIISTREVSNYFHLSSFCKNIVYEDTINEYYSLGIILTQVYFPNIMQIFNKHCLKIITTVLDLISYRCNYIASQIYNYSFISSIKYSDHIISISETVKNDLEALLAEYSFNLSNISSVLLGLPYKPVNITKGKSDYILVLSNNHHHKNLYNILDIIKNIDMQFIIIGPKIKNKAKNLYKNIKFFSSGYLSHEKIVQLYAGCKAILFPSEYEGFGLPVIEGLAYNKKIIVRNTAINHELQNYFDFKNEYFIKFDYFYELVDIIKNINTTKTYSIDNIRTYNNVAEDTEKIVDIVLKKPVNLQFLNERNLFYQSQMETVNFYRQNIIKKFKNFIKNKFPKAVYILKKLK